MKRKKSELIEEEIEQETEPETEPEEIPEEEPDQEEWTEKDERKLLEDGPDLGSKALIGGIKLAVKVRCVMAVAALFAVGIRRAYQFGYSIFAESTTEAEPGKEISIRVYEDTTFREIGSTLQDYGIIEDKNVFVVQAKLYETELLPGTYVISSTMTVEDILTMLSTPPEETGEGEAS